MATVSKSFCSSQSDSGSPIPSVIERLGQLRPSKELLEYYRKKIVEFDDEQQQVQAKLEQYKTTYEEQVFPGPATAAKIFFLFLNSKRLRFLGFVLMILFAMGVCSL